MQNFFYELSSNSFLLILVLIWVVPLVIAGFIGITRLRRVYKGLQMRVYPGTRRGELFDWTHGPKTPRSELRCSRLEETSALPGCTRCY
jgi:hypothetical protein